MWTLEVKEIYWNWQTWFHYKLPKENIKSHICGWSQVQNLLTYQKASKIPSGNDRSNRSDWATISVPAMCLGFLPAFWPGPATLGRVLAFAWQGLCSKLTPLKLYSVNFQRLTPFDLVTSSDLLHVAEYPRQRRNVLPGNSSGRRPWRVSRRSHALTWTAGSRGNVGVFRQPRNHSNLGCDLWFLT